MLDNAKRSAIDKALTQMGLGGDKYNEGHYTQFVELYESALTTASTPPLASD